MPNSAESVVNGDWGLVTYKILAGKIDQGDSAAAAVFLEVKMRAGRGVGKGPETHKKYRLSYVSAYSVVWYCLLAKHSSLATLLFLPYLFDDFLPFLLSFYEYK